jgi:hypothetical protein
VTVKARGAPRISPIVALMAGRPAWRYRRLEQVIVRGRLRRLGVRAARRSRMRMLKIIRLICIMQSCRREICPGNTHGLKLEIHHRKGCP